MKCKILYLIAQLRTGGQERQLYYLLKVMDKERYHPAVAVWNYDSSEKYFAEITGLGIPVYSLSGTRSTRGKFVKFRGLIAKLKPEVVHSYSFYSNFSAWVCCIGTNTIPIGSVRSSFIPGRNECGFLLGRLSAWLPGNQIFNSQSAAREAKKTACFFSPRKIYVVRNGIELDTFHPTHVPCNNPVQIAAVGSLLPVKRWDILINVAKNLTCRGLRFVVQIAGVGPLTNLLNSQIVENKLENQVKLVGHVENVGKFLSQSDFMVHTSAFEGCPNVVMESMACARAVIAFDVGDIPTLIEDGINGFIIEKDDVNRLTERITTLSTQPELCHRMGKAGRAKAEQIFRLSRLRDETLSAYHAAGWKNENQCAELLDG